MAERFVANQGGRASRSGARTYLATMSALVWKDLLAELRSRELLGAMLVFSLLAIVVFNFALDLQVQLQAELSAGVLWVTLAFAGTLGLSRSMAMERERAALEGLLLVPVDRSAIYFGKALANLLFILLVALLMLPLFAALYNVNLFVPGLLLVILLGATGYASVGTLLAAMAVQTRTRDVLLPILLFPVVLPLLIAAVQASNGYLQALEPAAITPWLNVLIVYDVIFAAIGLMVFDFVVQD